jgi:hypothetical protein
MAKSGYQAVCLDAATAKRLRAVAHYMSVTSCKRVTLSDALHQLVMTWAGALDLDDYVRQALGFDQQPARHDAGSRKVTP